MTENVGHSSSFFFDDSNLCIQSIVNREEQPRIEQRPRCRQRQRKYKSHRSGAGRFGAQWSASRQVAQQWISIPQLPRRWIITPICVSLYGRCCCDCCCPTPHTRPGMTSLCLVDLLSLGAIRMSILNPLSLSLSSLQPRSVLHHNLHHLISNNNSPFSPCHLPSSPRFVSPQNLHP